MRSRDVVVPAPETRESLIRRRELAARAAAARAEAERRESVHFFGSPRSSLGSPRFASLERIRVGRRNRGVSENFTPASPTTPSPRASHGRDFMQSGFDVFVNTSLVGTPTKTGSVAPNRRALRTPLEIAKLTGDAFHGVCLNPTAPHQLGLAAVRKGLVIADLTRLGPDAEHAAVALRSASASRTSREPPPRWGYLNPRHPAKKEAVGTRRADAVHRRRRAVRRGAPVASIAARRRRRWPAVLWRFDAERGAPPAGWRPRARPDASHPARPGPATRWRGPRRASVATAVTATRGAATERRRRRRVRVTPHRAGGVRRWGDRAWRRSPTRPRW